MKYYWCIKIEDWNNPREPLVLLPSNNKINFILGDTFIIKEDAFLHKGMPKIKCLECGAKDYQGYYPIKYGKDLTVMESIHLLDKLRASIITKIINGK